MAKQGNDSILSPLVTNGLPKFMSFVFHRCIERVLWTFAELGIADLMADHKVPLTATELSQLNGNNWNAELVYRLLRSVADTDIVKELTSSNENSENDLHPENVNRFQLTDNGLFLTSNHPSKARDLIRLELGTITHKPSTYLPYLIQHGYKNGNGFEHAYGCSLFDYLEKEENKEYSTLFNNAMACYSNNSTDSIGSIINFSRFEKLVDIGGGLGTFLSIILKQNKNLNGIVFDLEHVIENAKKQSPNEFQQRNIESNRYEFISGDMFKSETIPQADSYILKWLIHDWTDEVSIQILKSIRSANKSREKKIITIFLVETIIVPNNIHSWIARVMDIEMLTLLGAKERTKAEHIELLKKSGYDFKDLYETNSMYSVIEAITTTEVFI